MRKSQKYYAEKDEFLRDVYTVYRQYRWKRKAIWPFNNLADAERLAERLNLAN